MLTSDYDGTSARAAIASGRVDTVVFGRTFIANPDLPRRLRDGIPAREGYPGDLVQPGPEGYVDYPTAA